MGVRTLAASGGPDAQQVLAYDIAHAAAAVETARSMLDYGAKGELEGLLTCAFVADALHDLVGKVVGREQLWGLEGDPLAGAMSFVATYRDPDFLAGLAGDEGPRHLDPDFELVQDTFRRFAEERIKPVAEHVHRTNGDVPEDIIAGLAEMGAFGLSVPEEYGGWASGGESDYLGMVVATEELSRGSLGIGGSLITRPEILTRALVKGGTEEQKHEWLPKLASAEVMAAVAVTEPDFGSDVAEIKVTATPTPGADGEPGYAINGVKTWCTFGARADVLMLLARTDPDRSLTHRGLSLFVVPKPRGDGHGFEFTQDAGAGGPGRRPERWRAGPSTPSATAACTPTRWPSTGGGCRPTASSAATPASAAASTTRWRGSRTAGSRRRPAPSASCRRPTRRPAPTPATGPCSASPSATTSSPR